MNIKNIDKDKSNIIITILFILLLIISVISLFLGRYKINFTELLSFKNLSQNTKIIIENILKLRFTRVISCIFIGASLSLSGYVMQTVFHNKLVTQNTIGSASVASFATCFCILMNFEKFQTILLGFILSLLSLIFIIYTSKILKKEDKLFPILLGIIVSSVFSSLTSILKTVSSTTLILPRLTFFLLGSISDITLKDSFVVLAVFILGFIIILKMSWYISIITENDESAKSLGVNPFLIRSICITVCVLLTTVCVSYSGVIGFISLVAPLIARIIAKNNLKKSIITCVVLGAILLLISDDIARTLFATELPIGIVTSMIGAPIFFYFLIRKENA